RFVARGGGGAGAGGVERAPAKRTLPFYRLMGRRATGDWGAAPATSEAGWGGLLRPVAPRVALLVELVGAAARLAVDARGRLVSRFGVDQQKQHQQRKGGEQAGDDRPDRKSAVRAAEL